MGQAFISYSRRDKEKLYAICEILTDAGFPHWLDKEDIPPSEQWRAKIVEGIKNSDSFVLFISPASISSPNVVAELNIASEQEHKGKLKIIPVLLTPTELTYQVEYQLSGIQRIDLSHNFTAGLENLLSTLGNLTLPRGYKKHLLSYLPGTYITPELISPLPNPSQEVVVGKTINIKQIRDQRFMQRPKVLANAIREVDIQLKEHEKSKESEIFTFWLHGRSGSGKSVLLLQLLQEIVLQRHAQAFWFYSDQSEKLFELFEKWAEQGIGLDEPLFVFIDDLNTPLTRDVLENKSLSSLLRNPSYENVDWPIIVTCSPPEYLEDFRNAGKDEGFRIREWEIPTIDAEESKQLIQWFETRTGRKAKTGKAFEQSEGLALSMLFELWYYSQHEDSSDKDEDVMKTFGQRFKARLEGLNLTNVIAPILALNRLYIWPPQKWINQLSAAQKDGLATLNTDNDFSILTVESQSSEYIRLTHPHICNAIYKSIRSEKAGFQRAEDLANAFDRAIQFDDVLASRILLAIAQGGERISHDLNETILAEMMSKTWTRFEKNVFRLHPIGIAYIWTNWARWANRESTINYLFAPARPLDRAIETLGSDYYLWGDLWLQLWECEPGNSQLSQNAWVWVNQHNHFEEAEWFFVWLSLQEYPKALPPDASFAQLLFRLTLIA